MSSVPDVKFDSFYRYDEMVEFLKGCQAAAGDLCKLASLVETPEGRQVWIATLTDPATGAPEDKPAYYVQASVHAQEMAGTTAALRLIHTLLTAGEAGKMLQEMTFYVVPRANPDGVEYAMTTGGTIRSRNEILEKRNGLVPEDINGDGLILNMRWEDSAGPFTEDPEDPRIMVPRRPGDEGPFYQQYQEGTVRDYDGGPLVSAVKGYDFNRNYPANWDFNTDAADHPFAQPEIKAVGSFLLEHKNVFAGIDFHCGSQAVLRPSSTPDNDMNQADLGLIIEIGKIGEKLTGFGLMNVRDYRDPWRAPITLRGNSGDFAYFELGISWYVIELGNGYSSSGIDIQTFFNADEETRQRDFMRRLMEFADESEGRDVFVPWQDCEHPQLGKVQVGGMSIAATHYPYPPHMAEISANTTKFLLEHASWHPQLCLSNVEVAGVGEGVYRLRADVANTGRFATNVMSTGIGSRSAEPVAVKLEKVEAAKIFSRPRVYEFAALGGGGGGQQMEWFVGASPGDEITITASHPRGGIVRERLKLP